MQPLPEPFRWYLQEAVANTIVTVRARHASATYAHRARIFRETSSRRPRVETVARTRCGQVLREYETLEPSDPRANVCARCKR